MKRSIRTYKETEDFSVIGTNYVKVDAEDKVTGRGKYSGDIILPGMLYGKILRSPHAHAKILSINTEKAKAYPGVKAVITGKDLTGGTLGCVEIDEATADKTPLVMDKARYIGDEIAAVAAIDEATAEEALKLIEVEYEILPAMFDPEESMKSDTNIHEKLGTQFDSRGLELKEHNVSVHNIVDCGDVDKAFAQADYTDKRMYRTQRIAHSAIEPHAACAKYENGQLTIWSSTQSVFLVRYWLSQKSSVLI